MFLLVTFYLYDHKYLAHSFLQATYTLFFSPREKIKNFCPVITSSHGLGPLDDLRWFLKLQGLEKAKLVSSLGTDVPPPDPQICKLKRLVINFPIQWLGRTIRLNILVWKWKERHTKVIDS